MLGWNVLTDLPSEEIDNHIEAAAREWFSTEDGRGYVQEENLEEWGVDYANAMMNVPPEIFAKHHIYPGIPIYEIIELDADENLLPDELRVA